MKTITHVSGKVKRAWGNKPDGWFGGILEDAVLGSIRVKGHCRLQVTEGMLLEADTVATVSNYNGEVEYDADQVWVNGVRKWFEVSYNDRRSVIAYLSSKSFRGIGKAIATRICDKYGMSSIDMITNNPDKVKAECRLSDAQMKTLYEGVTAQTPENLMQKAFPHMSVSLIAKALETDEKALHIIKSNPYWLMDLEGVSFATADNIAVWDCGIGYDDERRMTALIPYVLSQFCMEENCVYVNLDSGEEWNNLCNRIRKAAAHPLFGARGMSVDFIWYHICRLTHVSGGILHIDPRGERHLYSRKIWDAQQTIKYTLLNMDKPAVARIDAGIPDAAMRSLQRMSDSNRTKEEKVWHAIMDSVDGDRDQASALRIALERRVSFVTGGPGCGKSLWIRAMYELWTSLNFGRQGDGRCMVLAPTGKAVNNLKNPDDGAGISEVQTVARFLMKYQHSNDKDYVATVDPDGKDIPLDESALFIVDEASMLDYREAAQFLSVVESCNVVFVGDADQLPPIEPGEFFEQVMKANQAGVFKVTRFKTNHRVKDVPTLIENADKIREKKADIKQDLTFQLFGMDDGEACKYAVKLYETYLAQGADHGDILLMSPLNGRDGGVDSLNYALQQKRNPEHTVNTSMRLYPHLHKRVTRTKGFPIPFAKLIGTKDSMFRTKIRIADRVRQTKNYADRKWYTFENDDISYERKEGGYGLYNGDTGTVVGFCAESDKDPAQVIVQMDGPAGHCRFFFMNEEEFSEMSLAYATTIHKAQGSQAKHVILVLPSVLLYCQNGFLSHKLIYTAVTRAKKNVTILGSRSAFDTGVTQDAVDQRSVLWSDMVTSWLKMGHMV